MGFSEVAHVNRNLTVALEDYTSLHLTAGPSLWNSDLEGEMRSILSPTSYMVASSAMQGSVGLLHLSFLSYM